MNYLVLYDVSTVTAAGQKRLRRVARICEGYGQRVQYSVFEVVCSPTTIARLCAELTKVVLPSEDSLRIYPVRCDFSTDVIRVGLQREIPHEEAWTL